MSKQTQYSTIVRNVIGKTLMVQAGENAIVETWDHGLPLASEFVYQLRELGARPILLLEHEPTFWRSVTGLQEDKLGKVGEHEWAAMEKAKHYIFIPGPGDFKRMLKTFSKYRAAAAYNESWYENAKKFRIKGARLALGYATKERAKAYGLNLQAWQGMLVRASSADFSRIHERAAKLANLFRGNGQVKIIGPRRTGLSFRLANRMPWADDSIVDEADLDAGKNMTNIPAGEVIVAIDETSTEGSVVFDRPTPSLGKRVSGMRWNFSDGILTSWNAQRNAQVFQDAFDKADGDKNRLGAFSIGLNPMVKSGFMQDDYSAGCVTLGLGDNEDYGGVNKTQFFFKGFLTKATLTVDGQVIVDEGKIVVN